jgi:HlyD family secretion protein
VLLINPAPELSGLGEIQIAYQAFQNQLELTKQTLAGGGIMRKRKNALQKDVGYLNRLKANSAQQKELTVQNKQMNQKEYEAYEKLASEKVIAPLELNQYKEKLIAKEQSLQQLDAQLTNNDLSSHGKRKEILELQKQVTDQRQVFYSSLLDLKSQVEIWIQQYVLTAPAAGNVIFITSLQENELISNGQGLFYIQPRQTQFYAELLAGQKGFGKIKPGQKVLLKPESYPGNEFGYLAGSVSYISEIPNRSDSFLIKADLPGGLKTNYGHTIYFRNGLQARAEIITENRRLFHRLTGQLRKMVN